MPIGRPLPSRIARSSWTGRSMYCCSGVFRSPWGGMGVVLGGGLKVAACPAAILIGVAATAVYGDTSAEPLPALESASTWDDGHRRPPSESPSCYTVTYLPIDFQGRDSCGHGGAIVIFGPACPLAHPAAPLPPPPYCGKPACVTVERKPEFGAEVLRFSS